MIEDYKRKKLLLQEDMEYMLKLCENINELMEKKEEEMHKMVATLTKYPKVEDEIVRFNVGGTMFATSRSNITKKIAKNLDESSLSSSPSNPDSSLKQKTNADKYHEPSLLEGLVSGIAEVKLDSTGAIFIDRNPKYFDLVLDFLRCANSDTPFELDSTFSDQNGLRKEALFYNVQGLVEFLQPKMLIESVILQQDQKQRIENIEQQASCSKFYGFDLFDEKYRKTRQEFQNLVQRK